MFGSHYNELLACDDGSGKLRFSIKYEELNTGDGAPRAAAMAFDMAYVDFGNKRSSRFISFTVQDYLESADEEKLKALFMIANSRKIQTVVSILSDKLYGLSKIFLKENVVLTLSADDKFFKIK
ncbi:DUF2326 domain-containing protein [Pseudomonas sp. UBA7530]|uniref:DUF2326 domain-containing protein n=1 Tax=Pseudomonas sp. UBA7530 TaxID=1947341 RepID=UPI003AF1BEDF